MHKSQIDPIHQAEDLNSYQNYHQSDSHKTISPQEGFPEEEDSPEDFQEAGDSQEAEESLEVEDIQEEVVYHLEALLEAHGDHPHSQYHKLRPENW